jgi:hypothetical protein
MLEIVLYGLSALFSFYTLTIIVVLVVGRLRDNGRPTDFDR